MGFTERGAAGGKVMRPKDSDVFDEKGPARHRDAPGSWPQRDLQRLLGHRRQRREPAGPQGPRRGAFGATAAGSVRADPGPRDGGTRQAGDRRRDAVCSQISEFIVTEYVEALGEGARFPPVVVFRADGADVLADGFHRVRAYQQAGRDEIEADVYEGGPAAALWFALGANRPHGQRLTDGDKQRAIEMAYKAWPDVSQRRIAAHVGCSHQYVGIVRGQLAPTGKLPDTVVGRDGRRRPATRPARKRVEVAPIPRTG